MAFNPLQCEVMHITRSKSPINNSNRIHDKTLRAVRVATHLRVDISNNLSWNPHINKIVNKANSKLGVIKRNLKSVPQSIKGYDYQSGPHTPRILLPVWDPYTTQNINCETKQTVLGCNKWQFHQLERMEVEPLCWCVTLSLSFSICL